MDARALQADSLDELVEGLDELLADDFRPTLAIVFVAVAHDLEELARVFASREIELVGVTSSGEFVDDTVYEEAIVGLLLAADRASYFTRLVDGAGKSSREVGAALGRFAAESCARPGLLVFSAGLKADGEQIVSGVLDAVDQGAPLFGGLAGDDLTLHRTSVALGESICHDGALALVFDQARVELRGVASSGWQPIGASKTVTRAEGNLVFEIDGQPAIDVYKTILHTTGSEGMMESELPLLVYRDDGSAVVRTAMMTDHERGALVYAGTVRQGARVRFASPPGFEITEHAVAEVKAFQEREAPAADAVLIASCKGRHLALGPMVEDEIEALHELWARPTVGFFSFGEIGRLTGSGTDFHNNTFSLVTIRERE
ncbi:MAG: FIST C-terminal domain-containing protein [Myxococcales bacterium]|nr:FIST C-terminal domain-containing protein [Myxococcales bacterium]